MVSVAGGFGVVVAGGVATVGNDEVGPVSHAAVTSGTSNTTASSGKKRRMVIPQSVKDWPRAEHPLLARGHLVVYMTITEIG